MPWWKHLALNLYCWGTLPYRRQRNRVWFAQGRAPVIVLFCHRIADDAASPWTMPFRRFARLIRWLERHCDLVSLEAAQQRIRSGASHRVAASITFDDGYAANCERALPWLISQGVPCTYFVSSRHVLEGVPFEHDIRGGYLGRPNSIQQLRSLAAAGVEIGAHTRTHADLGKVRDPVRLYDEVVAAGEDLQRALGKPVRYFAFPFGQPANLNRQAFQLAYEHGYEAVCSAYGGYNFPGDDAFHLQRIHLDYLCRLRNWVTLDPRKTHAPYRYSYDLAAPPAAPEGVTP
jgi:peptidoglycan/xylan/chitin deacetylase (PgdA/CDA1 family)